MERELFYILGIVVVVAAVGYLTVLPSNPGASVEEIASDGISGNVVLSPPVDACDDCIGAPVCAVKGQKAINYPSACAAICDDARVIYDDVCERIPRTTG